MGWGPGVFLDFAGLLVSSSWICLPCAEWSQVGEVTLRRGCLSPPPPGAGHPEEGWWALGPGRQKPTSPGSGESHCLENVQSYHQTIQIQVLELRKDTRLLDTISSSNKPWETKLSHPFVVESIHSINTLICQGQGSFSKNCIK